MDDLAIQLYRVDNPDGVWEYEDEAMRLHYRKMALEETKPGSLKTTSTPQVRGLVQRPTPAIPD